MTAKPVPRKQADLVAQAQRGREWEEVVGMSGEGTETTVSCEAAAGGGGGGSGGNGHKKRDSLGAAGSPAHLIIKGTE